MRSVIATCAAILFPAVLLAAPPSGKGGPCCGGGVKGCCSGGGMACCVAGETTQGKAAKPETGKADSTKAEAPAAGPMGHGLTAGEHGVIQSLLSGHATIARRVDEVPGGVKTTTTTSKPEQVEALRSHVRQMTRHVEEGRPVRMWDPVFRGIFDHHTDVVLTFQDVPNGIEVTETSKNPEVVPLIRAHARKVNAFVAGGHAAARPPWAGGGRGRMMQGK